MWDPIGPGHESLPTLRASGARRTVVSPGSGGSRGDRAAAICRRHLPLKREALDLLPTDSRQYQIIAATITELGQKVPHLAKPTPPAGRQTGDGRPCRHRCRGDWPGGVEAQGIAPGADERNDIAVDAPFARRLLDDLGMEIRLGSGPVHLRARNGARIGPRRYGFKAAADVHPGAGRAHSIATASRQRARRCRYRTCRPHIWPGRGRRVRRGFGPSRSIRCLRPSPALPPGSIYSIYCRSARSTEGPRISCAQSQPKARGRGDGCHCLAGHQRWTVAALGRWSAAVVSLSTRARAPAVGRSR